MAGSGDVAVNLSGSGQQSKSTSLDASGQPLLPTKKAGSGDIAVNLSESGQQSKSTGLDASRQPLVQTKKVVGEPNRGYGNGPMDPEELMKLLTIVTLILLGLKRLETTETEDVIQLLAYGLSLYVIARVIYAEGFERGPERRKRIAQVVLNTYTIALSFAFPGLFHPLLIGFGLLPASIYALIAYRRGAFQ